MDKRLFIVRGLPGSGISLIGNIFRSHGYKHIDCEQFFYDDDGNYRFNKHQIDDAVAWSIKATELALKKGHRVVVTGYFSRIDQIDSLVALSPDHSVIESVTHGIPPAPKKLSVSDYEEMIRSWERWPPANRPQKVHQYTDFLA